VGHDARHSAAGSSIQNVEPLPTLLSSAEGAANRLDEALGERQSETGSLDAGHLGVQTRSNGVNNRESRSGLMPGPVSLTEDRTLSLLDSHESVTGACVRLY